LAGSLNKMSFYPVSNPFGSSSIYSKLCPVRKYRGRTPAANIHPSKPSFEKHWQDMKAKITEAPKNHADAKRLVSVFTCYPNGLSPLSHRPSLEITGDVL